MYCSLSRKCVSTHGIGRTLRWTAGFSRHYQKNSILIKGELRDPNDSRPHWFAHSCSPVRTFPVGLVEYEMKLLELRCPSEWNLLCPGFTSEAGWVPYIHFHIPLEKDSFPPVTRDQGGGGVVFLHFQVRETRMMWCGITAPCWYSMKRFHLHPLPLHLSSSHFLILTLNSG